MSFQDQSWLRKLNLTVQGSGPNGLDLSDLRVRFQVLAGDYQSPNNAAIRVYNLKDETAQQVQDEFSSVILKAGYEEGAFGIIFAGDIKQFKRGRESATDTYLDILAADGDSEYNFGTINQSFPAGSTSADHLRAAAAAMGLDITIPDLTGTNPRFARGRVGFGMGRDLMRVASRSLGSSWSIQGGKIQVIEDSGYLPGEAVEINQLNGMIGIPEQTDEGVKVRTLLNPKLRVGTLVKLNTADITRLIQQNPALSPMPFNQRVGIQFASKLAEGSDGLYRLYVVDHQGDIRGNEWYSDLICLLVNRSTGEVADVGTQPR